MLFLTYWFVAYAAILFPIYWMLPDRKSRRWFLLVGSVLFHAHFAGPAGVLPIVALGVSTYFVALWGNRSLCRLTILANIISLIYYKYAIFLSSQVLATFWHDAATWTATGGLLGKIVPPLAISFFVFEYVHYLLDVSHGSEPIRDPVDFALFSVFWPSIVAGPVKRYQEFIPDLHYGLKHVTSSDVAQGVMRVGVGFVKKFIADTLTSYITFAGPRFDSMPLEWRWFLFGAIGLRILLDFSGYTDMAVGFARMHGIRLPENFNWPYLARNLTEFWRSWHMSLSSWIRDYVYIALGGSRCGMARKITNGILTFALCGLWHGAGVSFLVWGVYHGIGLAIVGSYRSLGLPGRCVGRVFDLLPGFGWLLTLLFVFLGWLFFFYPVPTALHMMLLLLPEKFR